MSIFFLDDYIARQVDTVAKPICGNIEVQTQYQFLLDPQGKTRNQDFKVVWEDLTYIEFQNRADSKPPIDVRAQEYFGLGVGHSDGKVTNQIWLLAEDVDSVLVGEMYTNYIQVDEVTKTKYPKPSGMMFVSLTKVAELNSPVGELASFLLGRTTDLETIKDSEVRRIANSFKSDFSSFREDKEVKKAMTLHERGYNDGVLDGRTEGKVETYYADMGLSVAQIATKLSLTEEAVSEMLKNMGLL